MPAEQHRPALRKLLEEVNERIGDAASGQDAEGDTWEFFCECGAPDCREQVVLSLRELGELKEAGRPVLAPGHRLVRSRKARERARELAEEAQALRAQARHQAGRARRNLGEPRWRVAGSRAARAQDGRPAGYTFELVRVDDRAERTLDVELVGGDDGPRSAIDELVRSCLAEESPPRRVVVDGRGRLIRAEPDS